MISPWAQVDFIQECQQLTASSQSYFLSSFKGHETGVDPKDWRKANLIFIKGKKDKQENYRLRSASFLSPVKRLWRKPFVAKEGRNWEEPDLPKINHA